MNKINQQQFNQMYQQHSLHTSEQLSQKTAEEFKKQRENLRRQTFFTPIPFIANNAMHNSNINSRA